METQDVADILHVLAGSKLHQGDHSEAVRLAREAVALHRRVHGNEHPETGHGLGILAGALEAQGDLTTAEAHYRETLAIFRKQYGEYNWTVSWFMRKLAAVLRAQGKPEEAEGIYRAFFSQTPHIWQDFMERASVYAERGEHELALEDREKGVALLERLVAKFPDQPDRVEQLHSEYSRLGNLLRDIGRLDDAEKVYCKAMAISEKLTTDFPDVLEYQQELAKVHCHRARARRAIPNTSPEVLDYFDSGAIANTTAWEHVTDTRTAPVGTRLVRVRLWSVRNGGTNNDGYFDDLSFRDPTGGNLLANPGNEKGLADGKIPGWTTDGTWQRRARDPMPHGGMAYFFPGARALAELRQDVDVSAHAAVVDAGKLQFTFEGYVRSFKQTPADTSRIILEYRSTGSSLKADTISEDYLKAIELGADDTVCAEYIGWMRLNGDADKAYRNVISRLQKVIDEFPEEPESRQERAKIYRRLGKAHREKGDSDQSIAAYTEAIRLDPELTVAREGRGNTYREKGEFAKAVTDYGEAIRRDPKRVQAHMFRAECYCKIGEYDKANADLDAASQLDPRSSPVLYNITAWSLVTSQDLQPRDAVWAVQLANKAVKLSPGEESYWNTLGVAQYRAGEWKAVIATLEKAIGLRSGVDSSDWFFLAMAHCQLGEKDKARQWYNKAVEWMDEHKPEDEELRRFRAEAAELLGVDEKPKAESGERETAPPQSPTLPGGSDAETPTKEEGTENDR